MAESDKDDYNGYLWTNEHWRPPYQGAPAPLNIWGKVTLTLVFGLMLFMLLWSLGRIACLLLRLMARLSLGQALLLGAIIGSAILIGLAVSCRCFKARKQARLLSHKWRHPSAPSNGGHGDRLLRLDDGELEELSA